MGPSRPTKHSKINKDRTVDWVDERDPENIKVKRLPGVVASVTQVNFGIQKLKRAGMPKKDIRKYKESMWGQHKKKLEELLSEVDEAS
jgi:hypothetical protein